MTFAGIPPTKLLGLSLFVQSLSILTSLTQECSINLPAAEIRQFMNASYSQHYGEYPDASLLQTLWGFMMALYTLGKLISCLYTTYLAERFGRKQSLFLWANVVAIIGNALFIVSKYTSAFELLFVGRLVTGMAAGMAHIILPLYMTEVSPVQFRGFLATMRGLLGYLLNIIAMGLSLPFILGSASLWPFNISWPIIFCFVQIISMPFCPESPSYDLISRGSSDKASVTVQSFFGKDGESPEAILATLQSIAKQQKGFAGRITIKSIWRSKALRMGFILAIALGLERAAYGHYAVASYSTDIITSVGIERGTAQYITFFLAVLSAFVCMLVLFLVERMGRRSLVIYPTGGVIILWLVLAISRMIPTSWADWLGFASIISFTLVMPFLGCICYFLAAELVPQSARSASSALQMVLISIWGFLQLFLLPIMETEMPGWSYIILFVIPLIGILVTLCLFLPETRQRPICDIMDDLHDTMVQAERSFCCATGDTLSNDDSDVESLLSRSGSGASYGTNEDKNEVIWT